MKPLALSAILSPAVANQSGEMMRALARIRFQRFDQPFRNRPAAIYKTLTQFGNRLSEELFESRHYINSAAH